jgi:hypothetical protein
MLLSQFDLRRTSPDTKSRRSVKINAFIAAIKLADLDPALGKVELDQEEIEGYRLESQSILKEAGRLTAYLCLRRITNINFGALKYEIKANTARRDSSLVTSKAENDKVRVVFLVRSARGRRPVIYFFENLQKYKNSMEECS